QELSPYSTQHGVKGAEFDNVFVILDNGKWNRYNFKYLFENKAGNENIIERTRKIFYVACSRVKDNLVVYFPQPEKETLRRAREWFGDDNVVEIQNKN
ncbi:MAG TPA: ATP-dependent helicase, partial [Epsilonproteobacteria bacterium]|nr:ATP-dependent helicase [Campylobacterota bacterium]